MSEGPRESALLPSPAAPARGPLHVDTVRRQFDARSTRLPQRDFLLREINRRLIERLDYMRIAPRRIVDVGCAVGNSRLMLLDRYAAADWVGVDLSLPMLAAGRPKRGPIHSLLTRLRSPRSAWVCADAGRLPFAEASFDLLFSNLMLHWHPAPHAVFPEWLRVLAVDGLLLFSCFGPDTLKELRAACAAALPRARPLPFVDMHDFGDMMVAAGFATPVMDVETVRLTYESARSLLAEVRALGGNPRADRSAALASGNQGRALIAALEDQRGEDGRIALTFEVAYGHAWKPKLRDAAQSVVSLDRLRAGLAGARARGHAAPGAPPVSRRDTRRQ